MMGILGEGNSIVSCVLRKLFSEEGNLIEEQSEIINRIETEDETGTVPVMIIGNNNVFEVKILHGPYLLGSLFLFGPLILTTYKPSLAVFL